jgi:hypothetical protein
MLCKRLIALAVVVAAGVVLGLPSEASAQTPYRRQSATDCLPITDSAASVRSDSGAIGNGGSTAMRLVCPINDDSYLPKDLIGTMFVDVYDSSTTGFVDARACVSYVSTVGGACGPGSASSISGTGMRALSPVPTVWSDNPTHYGYIVVNLPPLQSGRIPSSLHGYELFD